MFMQRERATLLIVDRTTDIMAPLLVDPTLEGVAIENEESVGLPADVCNDKNEVWKACPLLRLPAARAKLAEMEDAVRRGEYEMRASTVRATVQTVREVLERCVAAVRGEQWLQDLNRLQQLLATGVLHDPQRGQYREASTGDVSMQRFARALCATHCVICCAIHCVIRCVIHCRRARGT